MFDTDICIYLMSGRFPQIDIRAREAETSLWMSAIVLAELEVGIAKSARMERNRQQLNMLLNRFEVATFDAVAAAHYGDIRGQLERRGIPIGNNDMLIAAHARSVGMPLITNNRREFDRVPGLKVETWI